MSKCKCGLEKEMYYEEYCPKCDIHRILKMGKRDSVALFPLMYYGRKFIEGFDKNAIWEDFCERDDMKGNDTYLNFYFDEDEKKLSKTDKMLKQALDELKIPLDADNEVFFFISW